MGVRRSCTKVGLPIIPDTSLSSLVKLHAAGSARSWLAKGDAASAAARNMPAYRIQTHTRHKSAEVLAGYIREADQWTKSGLDGVGF